MLVALFIERNRLGAPTAETGADELDVLRLAYLSGGASHAADAALVGLLEAGAALADRKRGLVRIDPFAPVPAELRPFRYLTRGKGTRADFHSAFSFRWQSLADDLGQRGLVPGAAEVAWFRWQGAVALCCPLLLGLCKVVVGHSRGRPVGILSMLIFLTVVLGVAALAARPYRNRAGSAALAAARKKYARAARAPLPEEMALAFALSGSTVLAGREYRWVVQSSSDGGGDGSGGGGGGGGCGGCGGGGS